MAGLEKFWSQLMESELVINRWKYGQNTQLLSIFSATNMDRWKKIKCSFYKSLCSPFSVHINSMIDMPAHVRTALTQTSLSIPLIEGKLALGQWQGIFLFEHRHLSATRRILMHMIGE